jgi:hypothetical protein
VKADLRRGSGGGPEEPLRSILRLWEAPPPPADLEEDLRRAFRRRKSRHREGWWLALAAALALLALWPLMRRETTPTPGPSVAPVLSPPPMPAAVVPPARTGTSPASPAPRVADTPRRAQRANADVVIVEPGQAELLVRFGEGLQRMRASTTVLSGAPVNVVSSAPVNVVPADAPETPTLAARPGQVPRYQGDWERVSGVWPPIQLSASSMGR